MLTNEHMNTTLKGALLSPTHPHSVLLFKSKIGFPKTDAEIEGDICNGTMYFTNEDNLLYLGSIGGRHFFLHDNNVYYEYAHVSLNLTIVSQ